MLIQIEPEGKKVACHPDLSILEALQKKDFDIIATICGGEGTCGKCKVRIISGTVSEPAEQELQTLSAAEIDNNIRLACQAFPRESLSLNIIASSSSAQYKTSLSMELSGIAVKPRVKKVFLQPQPPSLADQRADVERIFEELHNKGIVASDIAARLLPCLPQLLRQADWEITTTLIDERI
ncbi:MAG: 2Fe-2S iron-sulfur cluster binding domain-containing protein, partial [Desulfobulbaceae bacterium]|nr:2Fe-2S iron-sulfur cluster binding domain-containing protein [Desulfobulbaceae bacterium]